MFNYFARFDEKFALPIYPIVIFSYDSPQKAAVNRYEVAFPDFNPSNPQTARVTSPSPAVTTPPVEWQATA